MKKIQIHYLVALDGHQSMMAQTTINQKKAGAMQGGIER
jgi:hypothetical protein